MIYKLTSILKSLSALGILIIFTFVVYNNSLHVPFQFDDIGYICRNVEIHDLHNIKAIWHIYSNPTRFLSLLSFALNYHFHQLNVFGYHLINILIHALNGFFVWILVCLFFKTPVMTRDFKRQDRVDILAWIIALLFLAHPVETQAVTYISQRMTSMATGFYLLTLIAYLKGREGKKFWFVVSVGALIAGMLTKEIIFTVPFVVVMMELFFFESTFNRKGLIAVLFFLAIVAALHQFAFVQVFGAVFPSGSHDGDIINAGNYFLTQLRVVVVYLKLLLWPVNLNLDYDFAVSHSLFDPATLISAVVLILFFGLGIFSFKKDRFVSFCIFWFFVTLVIESSFIPIRHVIFEHRLYLPSIGFCMLFGYLLVTYVENIKHCLVVAGLIIVFYGYGTFQRNIVWQSEFSLWHDVTMKSPHKARGFLNLGYAYFVRGDVNDALKYINKAIENNPHDAQLFNTRGLIYKSARNFQQAMLDFNQAIEIDLTLSDAFTNRGHLYRLMGENDKAKQDYQHALELNPYDSQALNNLAVLAMLSLDKKRSLELLNKALEISPEFDEAYNNRSMVYRAMGETSQAWRDVNLALRFNPHNGAAYLNRAQFYESDGKQELALRDLYAAMSNGQKVNPTFLEHVQMRVEELKQRAKSTNNP